MGHLEVLDLLTGDRMDAAWKFYTDRFSGLATQAVQRHLLRWDEFVDICMDTRIQKWIVTDDGVIRGFAVYTNHLDAWPLISPDYFKARWPKLFDLQRIWYCGFVGVHDDRTAAHTFSELITAMYQQVEAVGGVIGLDVCRYNEEIRSLPRVIRLMLTRISRGRVRATKVDEQMFFTYETDPVAA